MKMLKMFYIPAQQDLNAQTLNALLNIQIKPILQLKYTNTEPKEGIYLYLVMIDI